MRRATNAKRNKAAAKAANAARTVTTVAVPRSRGVIEAVANELVCSTGRKKSWLVDEMNAIDPDLKLKAPHLYRILRGQDEMSAREMFAFCAAMDMQAADLNPYVTRTN